ncbi:hypothetical protein [Nocardia brasiliensis]|uniref:hypothetical protein n=1 Tax=Nocardia brasiliensis TaxID=37326 RepID=UPI00245556D5|nr:hypothetical protein [Nocardia brasiliensis]
MRLAPVQDLPRQTGNGGPAVECARELALGYAGSATTSESMADSRGAVVMTRDVTFRASTAALTGVCVRTGAVAVIPSADTAPQWCGQPLDPAATPVVVMLPNDLAGQSACGQRVELSAASAGDLVFWSYRDYGDFAPTRVGLALGSNEIVTAEPTSGQYVRESMPTAADVRVKRVLGAGT